MKKNAESKRKTITIDITDWYDRLKDISKNEIRSIEEQCRFFIKNGIEGRFDTTTITYVDRTRPSITTWPNTSPLWGTGYSGDTNVMYCGNSFENKSSRDEYSVDCELNKTTGLYETKD